MTIPNPSFYLFILHHDVIYKYVKIEYSDKMFILLFQVIILC